MENINKALLEYNLKETTPVVLLRESSDNFVYSIGEKNKTILRISKRLPVEDIKFEYEAIMHLFNAGVTVPKCLLTKAGNFYTLINGNVAVLFEFIDGHHINIDKDHLPTKTQAYSAGKGLGSMSNAAVSFKSSAPRKRNFYTEFERVLKISDIFINQFEGGKEFIGQIEEVIKFGKSQTEVEGLVHNDYRSHNVFFNDKDEFAGIIDFDWSCNGPIIKDLALAVVEWSFPDGAIEPDFELFDVFLEGYNSVAINKVAKDQRLYSWIKFTTLSDASTYFCDLAEDATSTKRIVRSYMYRKYTYFSKL